MSDHGNYFERVDVENRVLGDVLLKYKNHGSFDEVVDIHTMAGDHLMIMDQIDDKNYTFSYFRKREVCEKRDISIPHNLYEVLPAILRIISQIVVLKEETFNSLKKELYDIRERIAESYTQVRWEMNASEAELGYGEESAVELYIYDSLFGSSYKKVIEWCEQDRYQNSEETTYAYIDKSVRLKKNIYCKEASEKLLNSRYIDNTNKEYIRKRDIQETLVYLESKEGQNYLKESIASNREFLKQKLEDNGGDSCPIEYLELSVRAYNCLCRSGITTVGDLKGMTLSDLKHVRNLGFKSFNEVLFKLSNIGIELKEG